MSRTPCRGIVDTSEGVVGCHLVVVRLSVVARLAFHLYQIAGKIFLSLLLDVIKYYDRMFST